MPDIARYHRATGPFAADLCDRRPGVGPALGPQTSSRLARSLAALYAVDPHREMPDRFGALIAEIEKQFQ